MNITHAMEKMQSKIFYIEAHLSSLDAKKLNGIIHKE
jgi:hypothetical protein